MFTNVNCNHIKKTHMAVFRLVSRSPVIPLSALVADSATIVGSVFLGEHANVWFGAIIRGDNDDINIGAYSNIQDAAVLHADAGYPIRLGEYVSVGHQAMLHGCHVGDGSLIGIQAVLLNGSVIGKNCLVAAGALVTEGKVFPDNVLILGSPAKAVRTLSAQEVSRLKKTATSYVQRSHNYKSGLKRMGQPSP